jgi:hypothetical protein
MKRPKEITAKLKNTDIELQNYVSELEKENAKLHKTIAKMQAKDISQQNEITALKQFQPKINPVFKVIHETKPPSK